MDTISIHKANEHNLANISLEIPRDKLVLFTGISGSGKSSLAFDTIFAEGQRRYVESLSSYARQFIGQFEKPNVESIEGLSPTIAIDQKSTSKSPRSTVGTVTEISDFLRVLYAKIGVPHCPVTGMEIRPQSLQSIVESVWQLEEGSKLQILSPVVRGRKGEYNALFQQLQKEGYVRVRIDGEIHLLEELPEDYRLAKTKKHDIEVIVDRIILKKEELIYQRLSESIDAALKKSAGFVIVQKLAEGEAGNSGAGKDKDLFFSRFLASPYADIGFVEMSPRLFSFNSPYGACPTCEGLGLTFEIEANLLVPDDSKSLLEGAIIPFEKFLGRYYNSFLKKLSKKQNIKINAPYKKLSEREKTFLMFGEAGVQDMLVHEEDMPEIDDEDEEDWFNLVADFDGIINILQRRYMFGSEGAKNYIENFMQDRLCLTCSGARLKPFTLGITLGPQDNAKNIHEIGELSIPAALSFIRALPNTLSDYDRTIARQPIYEVEQRLQFLLDVGLNYLTLNRHAASLSGGEAQRIRLASQIGSGLSGILYVLDEPSIGLHPHNNAQLIQTLLELRDRGNSLIVVEHDEETIRAADWIIDIGPKAGIHGGSVVVEGPVKAVEASSVSLTGQYLSGKRSIPLPQKPRTGNGKAITLHGVTQHNLKNITVDFPLGKLIGVTGLSGSGKSTLVFDVLYEALRYHNQQCPVKPEGYEKISGIDQIDKLICIDQSPIGRSPRSNPVTYTGIFDAIRNVFCTTEESRIRGYKPGRFSFNVKGGRCEHCKGEGFITKEMHFLPNVTLLCEHCNGDRFNAETLTVQYHGKNIAEVLSMTVEEACEFFAKQGRIHRQLQEVNDVGLGYIQLGQPATTLSGGEAQRIKLAAELCKRDTGSTLYLMDEPTIGLHWYDLENLIKILNRLVDQGNTIVVIEHNLDLLKTCDHIIDLGPEGGEKGGEIIAQGPPQKIARTSSSYTGQYLSRLLK